MSSLRGFGTVVTGTLLNGHLSTGDDVEVLTIATNMAGRGVDIMLGGNPEYFAEELLKERGVKPVPIDTTPVPIWFGNDHTDPNDDYTTSVTAVLPHEPPSRVGAAAKEKHEE